jgi:hypothetical protein
MKNNTRTPTIYRFNTRVLTFFFLEAKKGYTII